MAPNPTMAELCTQNMRTLGLAVDLPAPDERMGSTDMGDISQLMPAIHAYFGIGPETIAGHSVEFAAAAVSEAGDAALINAAKALAMTTADLLAEPALLDRAKAEFQQMLARGQVAGWDGWLANGQAYTSAGFTPPAASRTAPLT
jgi:metal-dependent amidase/aminoacylase/carboxypeptidase family protein